MLRSLISLMLLGSLSAPPATIGGQSATPFEPIKLLQASRIPVKQKRAVAPFLQAKAGLLMDADSGVVLFEKNARTPLPMASLTKIMTAILILDNHSLDEVVTVQEDYSTILGVRIGLLKNEKLTVRDLLTGLLVRSGGDAALALGVHHSGSVEAFVADMNEKVKTLNLQNTHFKNPIGLDEEEHFSSAFDLAILTKYALRYPEFRRIVQLPFAEISSTDGKFSHRFYNTNKLLGSYLNVLGVKTGTTDAAGASLINLVRGPQNQEVIAVILNSPNRFQENKNLISWALRNYNW